MISVIVPVYNVFPFLGECIDTICRQSFTDIEILLIDDGSTDQSGEMCDSYAKRDKRIRVIHQENQGLSGARNTGIENAQGEYLIFVDSDDRVNRGMFQTMYDVMQQYEADLVICSHRIIQENEPLEFCAKQTDVDAGNIEVLSGRECVWRIYSAEVVDMTVAWNKLYRRSMFDSLEFPEGRLHEDEFLTYKILYPLKTCVYVKTPFYEYRERNGSIMEEKSIRRLRDKMDAFEERCRFFEQNKDEELYYETLRRYETSIAECILYIKENSLEKDLLDKLNKKFQLVYQEKVAPSKLSILHKMKYLLFMYNKVIYKAIKRLADK